MDPFAFASLQPADPAFLTLAQNEVEDRNASPGDAEQARARLNVVRALAGQEESNRRSTQFSLSRLLLAHSNRTPIEAAERVIIERASAAMGQPFDRSRSWLPFGALMGRTMTAAGGSHGGYLIGVEQVEPADVLRPWSVTASSGLRILTGLKDQVTIPTVRADPTATWVGEGVSTADSTPTVGQASATPRTVAAFVKVSRQLVRQGPAAEPLLRALLARALGAALDKAVLAGTGGAQPLGLASTPGIGSQAGGSIAHAGLLAMRRQVLDAGAIEANLSWIAAPSVQEVMGARERATGGGRFLWDGGQVLDRPAFATIRAPAATLFLGDFSQAIVTVWGTGIRVDVDPSQDFASGGLVLRALMFVDAVFAQPSAFSAATSVS